MAEAAGLAVGVIGLSGLFNNAVDCFEYVQIGRSFGRDFQTSLLKLDVARLQLTRWGESMGLGSVLDEVQSLVPTRLSSTKVPLAERLLGQILDLFTEAERASNRNLPASSSQTSLAAHCSASDLDGVPASLHQRMRDLAIRRQGKAGVREKVKWALNGKKQLSRLIEDIHDLVSELMDLQPDLEGQRRLCEAEISGMNCETDLAALRDVAADQDKVLSETIKKAMNSSPGSNTVTFSGDNNSGFQLGVNTGTVSGVSFG
ncbi:prion-inhibition and propagation-domain-containing protein [Dactylonectria estremocensis]|uniref:Prion-inhibition and propagation-domain-containing protein n=1 Tax=Dactylonectria estremocensis TaxID=1079267 RepID=A0A9P9E2U2_9HYPO|nr:prion-inhibition and propagation-domain-containing protein [Dactylonectria estremocensis]